jgi:predicted DNA-binding protein (MmcQ/YjbR family)
MINIETVRKLALAFDESEEKPHFDKQSFRVRKKIFATLDVRLGKAVLKLPAADQSVFSAYDSSAIYPVPGSWGRQGWTQIELKKVRKDIFKDAITTAYCAVAPKKLAEKYLPQIN